MPNEEVHSARQKKQINKSGPIVDPAEEVWDEEEEIVVSPPTKDFIEIKQTNVLRSGVTNLQQALQKEKPIEEVEKVQLMSSWAKLNPLWSDEDRKKAFTQNIESAVDN